MRNYIKFIPLLIIIILSIFIIKLIGTNNSLKESLPYLIKGEKIKYFNLIDNDGKKIDEKILKHDFPSLIFIFSRPCSPCNKSITYWKRLSSILKGKVNVYGIVLSNATEAHSFSSNAKLNFPIFIPEDINIFIKNFRIKINLPETILYKNGVVHLRLGEINYKDVTQIVRKAKGVK